MNHRPSSKTRDQKQHYKHQLFITRLYTYTQERFPLVSYTLLIASYFFALALSVLTYFKNPLAPGHLLIPWKPTFAAFIFIYLIFFHLRVFDELKDYADDFLARPDRPLPRGLLSKREMFYIALFTISIEMIIAFIFNFSLVALITILYSLLMLREFGIKNYLKRHIMIYAYSHELLFWFFTTTIIYALNLLNMPNLMELVSVSTDRFTISYTLYSISSFLIFEICRKLRLPSDENRHIETYSQVFGLRKASWIALGHGVFTAIFWGLICHLLGITFYHYWYLWLIALVVIGINLFAIRKLISSSSISSSVVREKEKVISVKDIKFAESSSILVLLTLNWLLILAFFIMNS